MNQSDVDQFDTDLFAILSQDSIKQRNKRVDDGLEKIKQETSISLQRCIKKLAGNMPLEVENWRSDQTDHRASKNLFETGVVEEAGLFVYGEKKPHEEEPTIVFVGRKDFGYATVDRALKKGEMRLTHLTRAQINKVVHILDRPEFEAYKSIWK